MAGTQSRSWLKRLIPSTDGRVLEDYAALTDRCAEGMAIYDANGAIACANEAFRRLDLPPIAQLREDFLHSPTGSLRIPQGLADSVRVKVFDLSEGMVGVVVEPRIDRFGAMEKTIGHLIRPTSDAENLFSRSALALGRSCHWRWIGVSRFVDDKTARFLGWWEQSALQAPFDQTVIDSACEEVIRSGAFCYYPDEAALRSRFPTWSWIDRFGIKSYAGLVYRVQGKAVGHIVALNDTPSPDGDLIEDLLSLVAHYIGAHLELDGESDSAQRAFREARSDDLTGLGNRLFYGEKSRDLELSYRAGEVRDVAIVSADLDGLKALNDAKGHAAGDAMIKSFGEIIRRLWRPSDHFFRLGSDDFTMIIPNVVPAQEHLIIERLQAGETLLQKVYPNSGVSYGYGFLSQFEGKMRATAKEADRRMYEMKYIPARRAKLRARE